MSPSVQSKIFPYNKPCRFSQIPGYATVCSYSYSRLNTFSIPSRPISEKKQIQYWQFIEQRNINCKMEVYSALDSQAQNGVQEVVRSSWRGPEAEIQGQSPGACLRPEAEAFCLRHSLHSFTQGKLKHGGGGCVSCRVPVLWQTTSLFYGDRKLYDTSAARTCHWKCSASLNLSRRHWRQAIS